MADFIEVHQLGKPRLVNLDEEIKAPFTEDTMINLAAQALGVEPSRLRKLAEADKEGRVAVLPCEVGGSMLNTIDIERPRIMKGLHFAVAYESVRGTIFYIPYDVFREYIDAGHVHPLHKLKEAQNGNKTDM